MKHIIKQILPLYGRFRKIAFLFPIVLGIIFFVITSYTNPKRIAMEKDLGSETTTSIEHKKEHTVMEVSPIAVADKSSVTSIQTIAKKSVKNEKNEVKEMEENILEENIEIMEVYTSPPPVVSSVRISQSAKARVIGKQTVSLKNPKLALLLLEDLILEDVTILKGSTVAAAASFENNEMSLAVTIITQGDTRYSTNVKVLQSNGLATIHTRGKAKVKLNNAIMILKSR